MEQAKKINKAKKSTGAAKGEKEKAKMKYEFHRVEWNSRIVSQWDKVKNIDLGHINIDEFK